MRKKNRRLLRLFTVAAILAMSLPSYSDKLGSPQYYAVATKDLPVGTLLSTNNIAVRGTAESNEIPQGAMWLSAPDEAYGFKIHQARKKNEVITGYDLLAAGFNEYTPLPADPLWIKYSKSAVVSAKRHEFAKASQYEQGALSELEKLCKANKHFVYMDEENRIFDILHVDQESRPEKFSNLNNENRTSDQIKREMLETIQTSINKDRRYLAIAAKLLPPKCQLVVILQNNLKSDQESLARSIR